MIETTEQSWEQLWLPIYPLASDDLLRGIYREPRARARGRRYIEANPQALSNLLVVDVDHSDAVLRSLSAGNGHPMPNVVVENPRNGHAHAVWALAEPVTRTEYARRKPLAYAAAVTEGLRRSLEGDRGYSGLITKNPEHGDWATYWISDELRTLSELEALLDNHMPPEGWRRSKTRRENPVGLGRNCALFETARIWAYQEARRIRLRNEYATPEDSQLLLRAIAREISDRNEAFSEPLPRSETRAIANSIHRWITSRFYGWTDSRTVNAATFTAIQSARGRKGGTRSGETRRAQARARWESINDGD